MDDILGHYRLGDVITGARSFGRLFRAFYLVKLCSFQIEIARPLTWR